tara:strand:- start:120 stop:707 length:588 start_codon:yes stop_codon:yes gene_type:complete
MENMVNSGSISTLKAGEVLLMHARQVSGGKVQLELAEKIASAQTINPLSIFNKSDERFSSGGARRAWLTAEPTDASEYLGIDVSEDAEGWAVDDMGRTILSLNILNPSVKVGDSTHNLRVEVEETTEPNDWQSANLETSAKRAGAGGAFIMHDGKYVFSNTRIVFDMPNHTFLAKDAASVNANEKVDVQTGEIFS